MGRLDDTARTVLACVCDRLELEGRPACDCYATVGTPMVLPCCECGAEGEGKLSVQVVRLVDSSRDTLDPVTRVRPCNGGPMAADMQLTLTRCHPTIDQGGNWDPADWDQTATSAHDDMEAMWAGLVCCDAVRMVVRDVSQAADPSGGCYAVVANITVGLGRWTNPVPPEG